MATDDCFPAKWVREHENAFYFEVSQETDLYGDSFTTSDDCHQFMISSKGRFLLLDDGQFQSQFLSRQQQSQPDCKCNIQIYHDSSRQKKQGTPIMLFFTQDDKKMVACCNNQKNVYPEVMNPPREILEDAHKAVFYLKRLKSVSNKCMFQSSLYPEWYLGFESDGQTSLQKLVLLEIPQGRVRESCEFSLFD